MAITYPLSIPSVLKVRDSRITMGDSVALASSPFTNNQQVQRHPGQLWRADFTFAPVKAADAGAARAFLASLRGQWGTFYLGDTANKTPRGTAAVGSGGYAYISGAGQTGESVVTAGWAASSAILKAGDYIQLGCVNEFTSEFSDEFFGDPVARLHMVLKDVMSAADGTATLDIWPRLRSSPINGATIVTSSPVGVFRLSENERGWDSDVGRIHSFTLSAVEAI